jgi:hypothetical protein
MTPMTTSQLPLHRVSQGKVRDSTRLTPTCPSGGDGPRQRFDVVMSKRFHSRASPTAQCLVVQTAEEWSITTDFGRYR